MPKLAGGHVTPKQLKIMKYLLRTRGATVKQIVRGTGYYSSDPKQTQSNTKNFYPLLNQLIDKRFLDSYNGGHRKVTIFFLSPNGLDAMYDYLGIDEGYIGSGFNNDYGHFEYKLYAPPKKHIEHFLLQTEIVNVVDELKVDFPGVYDYRDNRYSSTFFTFSKTLDNEKENIVKFVFRPDGELVIGDDIYIMEADRSTEKGKKLNWKFEGYKRYFDHLTKNNKPLPRGVIFISEPRDQLKKNSLINAGEAMRWRSLNKAFKKELGEYVAKVNLIYTTIERLDKQVLYLTLKNKEIAWNSALSNIKNSLTNIRSKVERDYILLLLQRNGKRKMIIMQKAEGCESIAWYRGIYLYKRYAKMYDEIILLYYYVDFHTISPAPVNLRELSDPEERLFFSKSLFMRIDENSGIWYNNDNEILLEDLSNILESF